MHQNKKTAILGISCFYHDAAAALLIDGEIVAAAQEERFTRKKHDANFPEHAVTYCLKSRGLTIDDIDHVVFYDKPMAKFDRLLQTYFKTWPRGLGSFIMAMKVWMKEKLWIEHIISKKLGYKRDVLFTEHHYAHAASAYYGSDFDDAVVITMDGVGEWDTTTIGYGKDNMVRLTHAIKFPHSLGLLYSAVTYYLGFKVNSAEYKVMGLAPYGNPDIYYDTFKKLITISEDGGYKLTMEYFAYEYGETMTNKKFENLFEGSPRDPESELTQRHKDIASALQKITEEIILKIVAHARTMYPSKNLCLAGGVALNCVANGKILKSKLFENIYIQPASGDAGGAVGAACYVYFDVLKNKKKGSAMENIYLGPQFENKDIADFIASLEKKLQKKIHYQFFPDEELFPVVAELIAQNYVIGWFQGGMEFGPRALGNRSIIADARKKENWQRVNLKIKFRESFRPFAPSVLEEYADVYFDLARHASPYMLLVADVKSKEVPAVTHVDNSARIQTVNRKENARYHALLNAFYKKTQCPVVINTSFNVRGEPIVCTPGDALRCFINTDMDYLVLGNYVLSKHRNPELAQLKNTDDYLKEFVLD
ncbi:MAG: carbamoyltransferase [bacterium]|nr:carbamoyltransferase [bacterium]